MAPQSLLQLEPGVAHTLATARTARLSNLRYDLGFTIPARPGESIGAHAAVAFDLRDAAQPLVLDFEPNHMGALKVVRTELGTVDPLLVHGHLVLPSSVLRAGANRVTIEFDAGDAPLNRNDDFLYTLFVPARAREVFPCFDQPDLKARWTLTLNVPADWATVANGAEIDRQSHEGRTQVAFAETERIPTYLFAFAAGKFFVDEAERDGRIFRMFHRETDHAKVARNRDGLFDLHASSLAWLEAYTDIPYPFEKFDFVLIPAFQFGGMEHPGAIYYNAASMMLEEAATENQWLNRASTIAHETAHMWFGDLVTMTWFTDVWMKEVFANFMAAKIVNPLFPALNHELRFLHGHYPAAYDVDRTGGTNAVRQALDNLKDAGTLYGAIVYLKSPIIMRQLEMMVGDDQLRDLLREYLRQYRFASASWPDLVALIDARTPQDFAAWSRAWVDEPGRGVVRTELSVADGQIAALTLTQQDPDPRRGLTWTQEAQVALGYADRVELLPVHLAGPRTDITTALGRPAPLFVLPNGGGIAYGEFHLDRESLSWLSANLPAVNDPLTRGSAWVTLWDALLGGELPAPRLLDLALDALPRETDELNVQRILSYLDRTFWKFTADSDRQARAPQVERVLSAGLTKAATTSLKSAYFNALRDVARTPATCDWLMRIWQSEVVVPGLPLAEADFIQLAQELAVRELPGWAIVLAEQVERTTNPDRKARLRFVLPALSADPAERDRFFRSLSDVSNRRHEAWVLDGVRYLHHALRAPSAVHHLAPSLDLLQEIQQTGDIFFPKRWMDATLGGHRSVEAARVVRTFLEHVPASYPERLRRIILASADDLFRASLAAA
jgi:aminopeptidase N